MNAIRHCLTVCLLLAAFALPATGQTVGRVEYFWDGDPGFGAGFTLSGFTVSNGVVQFDGALSIAGVADGVHRLGIRARNNLYVGLWSPTYWTTVVVGTAADAVVERIEYYFDDDPGYGNGTALTGFTPSGIVQIDNGALSAAGVSNGVHRLGIRAKTAGSTLWSPTYWTTVVVGEEALLLVDQVEYCWDEDPGYGNGIPLTGFTPGSTVQIDNAAFSTEGVSNGVHRLGIRAKTAEGTQWSPTYWTTVMVGEEELEQVEQVEYYWDEDPGFGNGTPVAFSANSPVLVNMDDIPVPTTDGEHTLCIRARAGAMWSPTYTQVYCIGPEPQFALPDGDHVCPGDEIAVLDQSQGTSAQTYYWWDLQGDGEDDLTTQGNITFSLSQPGTYTLTLGISNVTECRNIYSRTVIVRSTQAPAVSISTDNTSVCEGTAAVFVATTQRAEDYYPQYQWYRNGELLPGLTGDSVSIKNIQEGDVIRAKVKVDNPCAPADSAWSNELTMSVVASQRSHTYVTHCGPYTWELTGQTYNKSGLKFNKGTTPEGCPIRDTLELTIVDRWSSYERVTRCEPYTWDKTGQTYNKSGLKFYKGTAADGCPIRDTLELTISTGRHSHTYVTHCGSYTWDLTGKTYNKSGNKFYRATDDNGCPIRDTLTLKVVDHISSHEYVTSCGAFTWELTGQTYSQSGNKYHKATTPEGCPVRDTLTLTIVERWSSHVYVTSCGPYTWDVNGKTYNKSGDKFNKETDEDGCLIRDTLTLTIVDRLSSHEYVTNCGPYTWERTGKTYNKSGNKYYKGTSDEGCPIRDTLTLTVVDRWSSREQVTSCDAPYTWYKTGQTYNKSGIKTYKGTAEDGCPIRDTLVLTIASSQHSFTEVTNCGPYTWDLTGKSYNKGGLKFNKSTTPEGCPIRDTLSLTIVDRWSSHEYITSCGPYTWDKTGQTYNKSGNKFYKGTAADGCPIRDTLTLTVASATTGDTVATATGSFTWYGITFTSSAVVSRLTTNQYGCDSIVTLHLTITGKGGSEPQLSLLNAVKVYPNPTTGNVQINVTEADRVEVLDLVGRCVAVYEHTNTIDLSALADGTYTLRITMPEGAVLRRVVKR